MNTQTFAQVEDLTAITDEELMAVNGGIYQMIMGNLLTTGLAGAAGAIGGNKANEEISKALYDLFLV